MRKDYKDTRNLICAYMEWSITDFESELCTLYTNGLKSAPEISKLILSKTSYSFSARSIQRILKSHLVIRTVREAYHLGMR